MNRQFTVFIAFGLLFPFGGCATSSDGYYGGGYDGHSGYSGYSQHSGYGGYGYGGGGYRGGGSGGGYYGQSSSSSHSGGPSKNDQAVKALHDAAKNNADPASTLYQQMLIQQGH